MIRDDARCYWPPEWTRGGRWWGFALNLYGLRSPRNWGIGDFGDLHRFARIAKSWGADLVGVNPLHALHWLAPEVASPYSATSRRFLNPFHVAIEAVPEFDRVTVPLRRKIDAARAAPFVDYALAGDCKRRAFAELHARFRKAAPARRRAAFAAFCDEAGEELERFALYEALNERFARDGGRVRGWMIWPPEFQDPASRDVARFAARRRTRIEFYKYVQFVAHEQLAAIAADERAACLYLDLAVGVDANSAEVWADRDSYELGVTLGAPPDPLGPLGQKWGLAPFSPQALAARDGAQYEARVRATARYCSALRVDHVMSLLRQFHIPHGAKAAAGAYVPYPFETLANATMRASQSERCAIVGEDLGTVPDGFREAVAARGLLSYRLLLFERDARGAFLPPAAYPTQALATATTHDLPTLTGWLLGRDLDARAAAGELEPEAIPQARALRRLDATHLIDALRAARELEAGDAERVHRALDAGAIAREAYAPLVAAAYRFLASGPAQIVLVQLDDALGALDQANLPGTVGEYPNWRRKYDVDLDGIAADTGVAQLAAEIEKRVRGGSLA